MGDQEVRALNGVSFEIGEGEFISIMGPSGSGKTSLLMIIAGLEHSDASRAMLAAAGTPVVEIMDTDGRPPDENTPAHDSQLQDEDIYWRMAALAKVEQMYVIEQM